MSLETIPVPRLILWEQSPGKSPKGDGKNACLPHSESHPFVTGFFHGRDRIEHNDVSKKQEPKLNRIIKYIMDEYLTIISHL